MRARRIVRSTVEPGLVRERKQAAVPRAQLCSPVRVEHVRLPGPTTRSNPRSQVVDRAARCLQIALLTRRGEQVEERDRRTRVAHDVVRPRDGAPGTRVVDVREAPVRVLRADQVVRLRRVQR